MNNPIHVIVCVALGAMIGHFVIIPAIKNVDAEPVRTCKVVETQIWATQQCLKFQPACQMNKGPDTFAKYKQNKDWVVENCPQSANDFPLDLSNK
jgi:hypothetical protein